MSRQKVAIITGGASGLGLAVAERLSQKGWKIHIFDLDNGKGAAASSQIANSAFHGVDVTSWDSLSSAFDAVFRAEGQLDFVFANAGIIAKGNFYEKHDSSLPPPPPDESDVDTNLKGMARTTYLAQHYFRSNPNGAKDCVVVMTSSVAGIYPQDFTPMYSASKAGVINFMRSVAGPLYNNDGIRTYAICPGSVRTGLLAKELWDSYPQEYLTPMEKVTSTVEKLIHGRRMQDSAGKLVEEDSSNTGLVVEIFVNDIYFRDQPAPCNDGMAFIQGFMSNAKAQ